MVRWLGRPQRRSGLLLFGALGSLANYYANPIYSKTRGLPPRLAATLEHYSAGSPAGTVRLAQNFPDPTLWYYYHGPVDHVVLPPAANDEARTTEEVAALVAGDVQRVVASIAAGGLVAARTSSSGHWPSSTPWSLWPPGCRLAGGSVHPTTCQLAAGGHHLHHDWPCGRRSRAAFVGRRQCTQANTDTGRCARRLLGMGRGCAGANWKREVTLQLLDGSGRLAAILDQPLNAVDLGAPSTAYVLSIPWQLPPGKSPPIADFYDPAQPGAPRLLTQSGTDFVELAVFSTVN